MTTLHEGDGAGFGDGQVAPSEQAHEYEILSAELAEIIKPEETAIIVIDVMDAYFSSEAVLAQKYKAGTTKLAETAPRIGIFIEQSRAFPVATRVFTKMVERPDSMSANYRYKMEVVDGVPPLVEVNGRGWDYFGVEPKENDHEITKTHYNAFTGTDLHEHLKDKGVKTIILMGGFGSRCVAATAIVGADVYGYNVFVASDLIANSDTTDSAGQEEGIDEIPAFLQALDIIWGYPVSAQAIINTWEQAKSDEQV